MIEGIVPATVVVVATREELVEVELSAAEELVLGDAVPRRRSAFVTGRACAREALARLGAPAASIPAGARGEPLWPEGVVGSITHCDGYRASAVAWTRDVRALGIDAEPDARLPAGVLATISDAAERAALAELPAGPAWDRLLFSAKEAVYKAWFPLTGRRLEFTDVVVRVEPAAGRFTARLSGEEELSGRWMAGAGLLVTALIVEVGDSA